jgi:hypothetical protein
MRSRYGLLKGLLRCMVHTQARGRGRFGFRRAVRKLYREGGGRRNEGCAR